MSLNYSLSYQILTKEEAKEPMCGPKNRRDGRLCELAFTLLVSAFEHWPLSESYSVVAVAKRLFFQVLLMFLLSFCELS